MKKYKVVLHLMKDPSKGDDTFPMTYYVEAENESKACSKAEKEQEQDEEVKYRSVFSHNVTEV